MIERLVLSGLLVAGSAHAENWACAQPAFSDPSKILILSYSVSGDTVAETAFSTETYKLVSDTKEVLVAVRVGALVSPFSVQIYIDKKGGKFFRVEINPPVPVRYWNGTCQQIE